MLWASADVITTTAPAAGALGIVVILLRMAFKQTADLRANEIAMREEFKKERATVRDEALAERDRARLEIAEMRATITALQTKVLALEIELSKRYGMGV